MGQLKVNISNENGVVGKSDPIGVSETNPGIGVKAVHAQRILGYALEKTKESNGIQQILVFISPGWFNGANDLE